MTGFRRFTPLPSPRCHPASSQFYDCLVFPLFLPSRVPNSDAIATAMPKPKQPLKQRPPPTSSDPAHAQTLPADQPLASSSSIDPPIDPLLDLHPPVIDPSLADLVNQVDQSQTKNAHNLRIGQAGHGQDGSGEGLAGPLGHGLDEELDPDWREIVNSLNQASQVSLWML